MAPSRHEAAAPLAPPLSGTVDGSMFELRARGALGLHHWVQLGARGTAPDWLALRRQGVTVCIVDGEAEPLARLRLSLPGEALIHAVVSANGGEHAWHMFDRPRFNGLDDIAHYACSHPRLRATGTRQVATRAVSELLGAVAPEPSLKPGASVLGLDLGSRAAQLLRTVDEATLLRFGTVLLWHAGRQPDAGAEERLQGFSYRVRTQATALGGMVSVFELDGQRLQLRQLGERNRQLHASREALRQERSRLLGSLERQEEALQALRQERLAMARDQVRQGAALRAQLDAKLAENEALQAQLAQALESTRQAEADRAEAQASLRDALAQSQVAQNEAEHKLRLRDFRRLLDQSLRAALATSTRQVESYLGLQALLTGGQQLPLLHGWAVSADFALHQVQRATEGRFDLIIEFGSGSSTLLTAMALSRRHQAGAAVPPFLSFDHLPEYHDQTCRQLEDHGLGAWAQVVLAPLIEAPEGGTAFYDCVPALDAAARQHGPCRRVLVVVDGPPSATGPLARRPALDRVLHALAPETLELLLDDYRRKDEVQVVQNWLQALQRRGYQAELTELPFEKQAAWIQARLHHRDTAAQALTEAP